MAVKYTNENVRKINLAMIIMDILINSKTYN